MPIQYVNTGSSANAGNGDSIRLAFTKVNNNFGLVATQVADLQQGQFSNITIAGTATFFDVISTGTAQLNNVSIAGTVAGTSTFDSIVVQNTATINQLLATNIVGDSTATFQDVVVNGSLIGDFSFSKLNVATTITTNDLNVGESIYVGQYQFIQTNNLSQDFAIVKDDINGLTFVLRNVHADSYAELNLQDNIQGGLSIVHQDSTNNSGNYDAGQNYIYGQTPTDILNIGKYSDINFYANSAQYAEPGLAVTPSINISSTDGLVRFGSDTIYLNNISFQVASNGTALVNGIALQGGGGGGASVTTSDTAPESPSVGDLWYDTAGGIMYVYFDNSWIDTNPMPSVDLTQLINSGFSLSIDSAGVVNLPTITAPDAVIVQSASSAISLNANGSFFTFGQDGTLTFPDTSQQTGASISISELKTLLSTCNNFDDFKTAIAAL